MQEFDNESHEARLRELDAAGVAALFVAAGEYHQKHCKGPGAAAVCICGAGIGGSPACRGLWVLRDLFRYGDPDNSAWRDRLQFVAECFDR